MLNKTDNLEELVDSAKYGDLELTQLELADMFGQSRLDLSKPECVHPNHFEF